MNQIANEILAARSYDPDQREAIDNVRRMSVARNPRFEQLLDTMRQIHEKKNQDYASDENPYSNFEFAASVVGLFSKPIDQVFATLISVKVARLAELCGKGKTPKNESIADTQLDLAVYAALWASYRR